MRTRTPALALAAGAACLYLSSYSTGPARGGEDATSSGLGDTQCANCHRRGDFGTSTSVKLLDAAGDAVAAYHPGEDYTLRVGIATATTPAGYGFQVLAVDGAVAQAGTFGEAPAGTRLSELRGRTYFEHARRLTPADSVREITWTAPAVGTGEVTVYAVGNAVNANNSPSGDEPDEAIARFAEASTSTAAATTWPRGVTIVALDGGRLRVEVIGPTDDAYALDVAGVDGRAVASRRVLAKAPQTFDGLPAGLYVVRVTDATGASATRVVPVSR